jgi:hypothetical protein
MSTFYAYLGIGSTSMKSIACAGMFGKFRQDATSFAAAAGAMDFPATSMSNRSRGARITISTITTSCRRGRAGCTSPGTNTFLIWSDVLSSRSRRQATQPMFCEAAASSGIRLAVREDHAAGNPGQPTQRRAEIRIPRTGRSWHE